MVYAIAAIGWLVPIDFFTLKHNFSMAAVEIMEPSWHRRLYDGIYSSIASD